MPARAAAKLVGVIDLFKERATLGRREIKDGHRMELIESVTAGKASPLPVSYS